jgi:hypothetical protein
MRPTQSSKSALKGGGLLLLGGLGSIAFVAIAFAGTPVPTTLEDFKLSGTQPLGIAHPIANATECGACHGFYDEAHEPWNTWSASMMGQSARDPIFYAALSVANQDADFAGDLCLRCHTPSGFMEERTLNAAGTVPDGSQLSATDLQGVSCNFCHRMVDPVYEPGVSPAIDFDVLDDLTPVVIGLPAIPPVPGSGNYILDTFDRRRGPFDFNVDYPGGFFYHEWAYSPFHQESQMCATCHDVSNPIYSRQPDNSYVLNTSDEPHQTQSGYDMFPVERTYSEWLMSDFADGPIEMGGRFGGNKTAVSSCQDCHMPDATAEGCRVPGSPTRTDMPVHEFNGGNNWVLKAVRALYSDDDTGLTDSNVADSIARAEHMLAQASDMELSVVGTDLNVRIINQTGHKLPTGYPEGRRMWINVQFLDATGALVAEHGHYDDTTAELTTADTKVYEAHLGVDAAVSAMTGVPEGKSFHFVLNNVREFDNRIPPRGFTNAEFTTVQAEPVGYSYPDGQYWDDTLYPIPAGAVSADVKVYFQTTTKEYIEFLRDENVTDSNGTVAYNQWLAHGMSPIAEMDAGSIDLLANPCPADFTGDGTLDIFDVFAFLDAFNGADLAADFTGDGVLDIFDVFAFLDEFNAGCP